MKHLYTPIISKSNVAILTIVYSYFNRMTYTLFSATVVSTEAVSSQEQVQCLTEWIAGGGDDGRVVVIGGVPSTVSHIKD